MEERAKKILEEQNKFQKKNIEPEPKEKVNKYDKEDEMVDNPIFKDIKNEIDFEELEIINNDESDNAGLNSFNNISNILPNDLEDYMKNFDSDDKEEFDEDKIFVDF